MVRVAMIGDRRSVTTTGMRRIGTRTVESEHMLRKNGTSTVCPLCARMHRYKDWRSFKDSKAATSNINAAQHKLEKEQAEQMRKASVGEMSREELRKALASAAAATSASKNKSQPVSSGSASSSG
jgi:hypothetical protein